jgi:hypothetical protein
VSFSYIDIAAQLIDDSFSIDPDRAGAPEQIADEIMASLSLTRLRECVILHLIVDRVGDDCQCESDALDEVTIAHHDLMPSREK